MSTASDPQETAFLYPFLEADERDVDRLLAELARSATAKVAESVALRAETLDRDGQVLHLAAAEMAERFSRGGRLFAFGNGGSATDAEAAVALFMAPTTGSGLPAVSLVEDQAVLTALANDIGPEVLFARQLAAHARRDDIAMGFSTSGDSANVLLALEQADRLELCTVGFSGYEGGAMAQSPAVRHSFVAHAQSVHRIQETHNAVLATLWSAIQELLSRFPPGKAANR